jgi:hypothetical protein
MKFDADERIFYQFLQLLQMIHNSVLHILAVGELCQN